MDSLHAAVNRLESETNQQRTTNQTLQRHLDSLRSQLAGCFATIPLPGESLSRKFSRRYSVSIFRGFICYKYDLIFAGTHDGATLQNIDSYFERLESLLSGNAEQSLRNAVRSAVSRLELIG